jgi:hypothetical protein
MSAGEIEIPQGVNVLRFGGVDVNYTPNGGMPLNMTGQSNEFEINLGLPLTQGTSIIVNTVNSNAQANSSASPPTFQDYATFLVTGRLNLFQANEIDGNSTTALLPTQLVNATPTSGFAPGGTFVISQGGPATGQIGDVRVGGNATNFTTFVTEDPVNVAAAEGQLDAKIANYFIGGQTNNVLLVAPSGSRNISFGLGMDNVTINSLAVRTLRANRDATNSNVTVSRSIANVLIGGDVNNSNINVGEQQSLFTFANLPPTTLFASGSGAFFGEPPPTIINPETNPLTGFVEPFAQQGGSMTARIAGDVDNSTFSASVDPNPPAIATTAFGQPGNLVLSRGAINAKVEGFIDNSTNPLVFTNASNRAFFANVVKLYRGPIIPPTVPYQPYVAPTRYHRGQSALHALIKIDHYPAINHHPGLSKATATGRKKKG